MLQEVKDIKQIWSFVSRYFPQYSFNTDPYEKAVCFIENKKVVGFISYSIIYERAELNYIVTDDEYRKKGIASRLLNYALDDLKQNMVKNFSLEVNDNNTEAIDFYLNKGFEIKAIRHNYYGINDAYLMVLEVH